jgi:hypothetical protein
MPLALFDLIALPIVYPAAFVLKAVRKIGVRNLPRCKNALMDVGVFPIQNHYYEPLFDTRNLKHPLSDDRNLPGIDWNVETQLSLLDDYSFNEELEIFPKKKSDELTFYYDNGFFKSGDAEYWYNVIRHFKPARVFEVGSGYSTLMAAHAIKKNMQENTGYTCKHVCIEPFENLWLEKLNVTVNRNRIEDIDPVFFTELKDNDILFIDSSHMIRPQGDVLYECLELMPSLCKGVIVHIHDIFTPKDYLKSWIVDDIRFWNEQYLLEAFLSHNNDWEILASLNFLKHNYFEKLKSKCPFMTEDREPGSFYMRRK